MDNFSIKSIMQENRVFNPPADFSSNAHIKSFGDYERIYKESLENTEEFWAKIAKEMHWFREWDSVLEWSEPFAKWFAGAKTNISYNCIDRHLDTRADKPAIIWEGEPGDKRILTYKELHSEVCRFANVLKNLGIKKGDRVAIYMPMIPELAIAMLACARIGATHSVIFGGFSSEAIKGRVNDAKAKLIITADGGFRRGNIIQLKANVDEAVKDTPSVEHVIVVKRMRKEIIMNTRDRWWHELMEKASGVCNAEHLDSEHPLFILYTSGTTGKPKGVVHTTGGYMVYTYITSKWIFDLKDEDVYWCTADIGWVTGHSYVIYGPLANGATTFMYEGAPNYPESDRFWELVEKYNITIFYTAPTAIRAFIKWGEAWPKRHDLSSLRLLGTVGEPINPEAWMWYYKNIGNERCPIVDTWWQTETGGILITPLPGATPLKPGSATLPFPGIVPDVLTKDGKPVEAGQGGCLVIKKPWPGMLRNLYGDPERFKKQYWSEVKNCYFTGDGARRDEDGYYWIMGRIDDVLNVAGHRLGTMEIESALVSHPSVAEAAVVGKPDDLTGTAIVAFVTLKTNASEQLKEELRVHVVKQIGSIAKPQNIIFTDALPKTRSGKIMRRLLRQIACGETQLGDTTTLEDMAVLEKLRTEEEE